MVMAAAAALMARSAKIHSYRVRDALLRLDAECDEAGGEAGDVVAGLGPGQRVPDLVLVGVAVGLTVGGLRDPVVEHPGDAGRAVLDHFELFRSGDDRAHGGILRANFAGFLWCRSP